MVQESSKDKRLWRIRILILCRPLSLKGLEQLIKRLQYTEHEHELAQMILDNARRLANISEKLAQITRYASKDYVAGRRIIDLDEASKQEPEH